ncbi:MAG: hypothetical protein ACRENC_03780 [Gemmatimonadaceae bacterium]
MPRMQLADLEETFHMDVDGMDAPTRPRARRMLSSGSRDRAVLAVEPGGPR